MGEGLSNVVGKDIRKYLSEWLVKNTTQEETILLRMVNVEIIAKMCNSTTGAASYNTIIELSTSDVQLACDQVSLVCLMVVCFVTLFVKQSLSQSFDCEEELSVIESPREGIITPMAFLLGNVANPSITTTLFSSDLFVPVDEHICSSMMTFNTSPNWEEIETSIPS